MSRSNWAWTKAISMVFATSTLVLGLYTAPARAGSANGLHPQPSTTDSKPRSVAINHSGAMVLGPWSGYSSRDGAAPVRALQLRLARAGYAPGPIDGRYGPLTEQAVMRFQAEHGLRVDGVAGPLTLAAIRRPPTILYPGIGYAGTESGFVRSLQRRLASAGYTPGPIDGRYGPRTELAVSRFQASHGLQADGIAGPLTLGHLGTRMPNPVGQVARPAPAHRAARPSSRPVYPRPHTAHRQPLYTTVPTNVRSHSPNSLPSGVIALLIGLAATLVLVTMAFVARRRERRPAIANAQSNGASGNGSTHATNGHLAPSTPVDDRWKSAPADSLAETQPTGAARTPVEPQIPDTARTQPDAPTPVRAPTQTDAPTPVDARAPVEAPSAVEAPTPVEAGTREDAWTADEPRTSTTTPGLNEGGESNHTEIAEEADRVFKQALVLEEAGELTRAVAAYRRADELGHATAPSNLGVLLEQHGDRAGAEACYRRADDRGDPDGAFNLALLLGEQGDHTGALDAYGRADQLGHGTAAANLGVLLGEHGDLAAAEACFRRADERGDAHGAFNLAVLLDQHGDHVGALEAYRRAGRLGNEAIAERARAAARDLTSKLAAGKVGDPEGYR
ncbi:MAG: peptidoglycan-binding protein [Solirubrobacterales bacterium]|nr:peptidoglycan-binding protein [Solirubrobacterales bacterium]